MKKSSEVLLVAVVIAAAFIIPSLTAGETAAARPGRRAAIAGLTAEQKSGLQALRRQERDALRALQADPALSADEKRAKSGGIRRDYRDQARGVFTPEQRARLEERRTEPRGPRHRPA